MRFGKDQSDFEAGQRDAHQAGSSDTSPLQWLGGQMLKERNMKIILATLALAAVTLPATVTAAPGQQSIAVDIGDLDLTSDKGQRILALRIQRAARTLCKSQALESLPSNIRRERGCVRETQARALVSVKTLTATGGPTSGRGG